MSTSDFKERRIQRRLEDLERTNPTDIPASSFIPPSQPQLSNDARSGSNPPTLPDAIGTPTGGNTARPDARKKQSRNVRRIVLAKKTLRDWIEELPSHPTPPYLTAVAPPPSTPARKICASCGYIGAYSCPRCGEWSCDRACVEIHARDGGCGVGM